MPATQEVPILVEDVSQIPESWATVVSVCPFKINGDEERKPGLSIVLNVPAAENWRTDIAILHIKQSFIAQYTKDWKIAMLPVSPEEIGLALIRDYVESQIGFLPTIAEPGLFLLKGKVTADSVKHYFSAKLDEVRRKQVRWFVELVRIADDNWSKTKLHRSITDRQRLAARELGLERGWNIDVAKLDALREREKDCPFCYTKNDIRAAICKNCRCTIDPNRLDELQKTYGKQNPESSLGV